MLSAKGQLALDSCHWRLIIHVMKFKTDILLLVMVLGCFSSPGSTFYFNQSDPGSDVKIFATNIISVPGRFQQSITLSEDGKEYYYGITDSKNWNYETILCTRVLTNGQTVTETPSFVRKFHFKKDKVIGEPFLAPDGKQLFFVANNQPDIWVATRMEKMNGARRTSCLLRSIRTLLNGVPLFPPGELCIFVPRELEAQTMVVSINVKKKMASTKNRNS